MGLSRYEAHELQVKIIENTLTNIGLVRLSLWECAKLAVGQPNNSYKKPS